ALDGRVAAGVDHFTANDVNDCTHPFLLANSCSLRFRIMRGMRGFFPYAAFFAAALCANAALMNEMNNGCPSRGVDLNSGWYCTPTYHGCALSPLRGSSMISHSDSVGV